MMPIRRRRPERRRPFGPLDGADDLAVSAAVRWDAGGVYIALDVTDLKPVLTGERAFQGKTAAEILSATVSDEPTPIAELSPEVPQSVIDFVARMMAKKPANRSPPRFATAAARPSTAKLPRSR